MQRKLRTRLVSMLDERLNELKLRRKLFERAMFLAEMHRLKVQPRDPDPVLE